MFDCATIRVDYKGRVRWEPSNCEECNDSLIFHGTNYNHRVCYSCWSVIQSQLWESLRNTFTEIPTEIIWKFLTYPDKH